MSAKFGRCDSIVQHNGPGNRRLRGRHVFDRSAPQRSARSKASGQGAAYCTLRVGVYKEIWLSAKGEACFAVTRNAPEACGWARRSDRILPPLITAGSSLTTGHRSLTTALHQVITSFSSRRPGLNFQCVSAQSWRMRMIPRPPGA